MTAIARPPARGAAASPTGQWQLVRAQIKVVGAPGDTAGTVEAGRKGLDPDKPLKIAGVANAHVVDRVNEMIDPRGGDFGNFLKNPIMLADHTYSTPIGTCTRVWVEDDGVHFEADIGRPDLAPLTEDQIEKRSLIAQGVLQTVSIGFIPLEYKGAEFNDAGELVSPAVFTRWELLEISVVSVPCNADSIFQMKEKLMKTQGGAAGAAGTKDQPPITDDPATGTAGEMLKAIMEHCSAMREGVAKCVAGHAELTKSLASLHGKFDGKGKDDPKDGEDAPPADGTGDKPEPDAAAAATDQPTEDDDDDEEAKKKKAAAAAPAGDGASAAAPADATADRLKAIEASLTELGKAMSKMAEVLTPIISKHYEQTDAAA